MKVTVYGREECVQCDQTKKHLGKLGIPYAERDVDTDTAAEAIVMATGNTQLPMVSVVDEHGVEIDRWHGFKIHHIRALAVKHP